MMVFIFLPRTHREPWDASRTVVCPKSRSVFCRISSALGRLGHIFFTFYMNKKRKEIRPIRPSCIRDGGNGSLRPICPFVLSDRKKEKKNDF
jgi:hypothetical protein